VSTTADDLHGFSIMIDNPSIGNAVAPHEKPVRSPVRARILTRS